MPSSEQTTQAIVNLKTDMASINEKQDDTAQCITDVLVQLQAANITLELLRQQVSDLVKVVQIGNGTPSLLHRVANLEVSHSIVRTDVAELKNRYDSIATARMLTRGQIVAGVVGMIMTAMLALAALIKR